MAPLIRPRHWADKLARTLGVPLAQVAQSVWHAAGATATARTRGHEPPDPAEPACAAQKAVALA